MMARRSSLSSSFVPALVATAVFQSRSLNVMSSAMIALPCWSPFTVKISPGSRLLASRVRFLAMPAAVFLKLVVRDALARYRHSRVYEGATPEQTGEAAG